MRKRLALSVAILLTICFATSTAFAYKSRKDHFSKPQVGVWFGPLTPLGPTQDIVDNSLGGGIFALYSMPFFKPLKVGGVFFASLEDAALCFSSQL